MNEFLQSLRKVLDRTLALIVVLPLFGHAVEVTTAATAIEYLQRHQPLDVVGEFVRYEVTARFNNGDEIRGTFQTKEAAIEFLRSLR